MRKGISFVLVLFLLLSIAMAAEKKVFVVDLNYKDGGIVVKDIMMKQGYYPDRKLQPETGYTLEIVSEDRSLYSFKFEVPLKVYTDVINEDGEIEGGIIVLDESDFALVLPYFDDAKEIKIYDARNKEIANALVVPAFGERNAVKWIFGFILIFIVLFFFFYKRKPKRIIGVVR